MKASEINSVTTVKILRAGLFGRKLSARPSFRSGYILLGLGDILVRLLFKPEVLQLRTRFSIGREHVRYRPGRRSPVLCRFDESANRNIRAKKIYLSPRRCCFHRERYRIDGCLVALAGFAGGYIFTLPGDRFGPGSQTVTRDFGALPTAAIIGAILTRDLALYAIGFGLLTTIVNLVFFRLSDELFNTNKIVCFAPWVLPQTISFIAAVLFAYVTNRIFVFRSKGPILPEILKFFAARLGCSLLFEYGGLYVLVDMLGMASFPAKIIVAILVILANYVLSKLVIFVGKKADR